MKTISIIISVKKIISIFTVSCTQKVSKFSSIHLFSIFVSSDFQVYSNHRYAYFIYKNNKPQLFNYILGLQTVNINDIIVVEGSMLFRFKQPNGLMRGPDEKFDFGLNYNSSRQIIVLLGINITSNLRLGYVYDQSLWSGLYQNSTHEVMIEYRILNKASSTRKQCGNDFYWYR